MKSNGPFFFMPKEDMYSGGSGFPVSRDYGLPEFPCRRLDCAANREGRCVIPSRCSIDESGTCTGHIPKKNYTKKAVETKFEYRHEGD